MATKRRKQSKRRRKTRRRADYMTVAQARLYLAEWAAGVNKDVADDAQAMATTGRKVHGANLKGRPLTISDADLAAAWCECRRASRAWAVLKVDAVSQLVKDELARSGVTLSVYRITKRVRAFLTQRGQWNGGAGPR